MPPAPFRSEGLSGSDGITVDYGPQRSTATSNPLHSLLYHLEGTTNLHPAGAAANVLAELAFASPSRANRQSTSGCARSDSTSIVFRSLNSAEVLPCRQDMMDPAHRAYPTIRSYIPNPKYYDTSTKLSPETNQAVKTRNSAEIRNTWVS